MNENKPQSGWVRGFYKSWAWLAAVAGFVVAVVPDLAAAALSNIGLLTSAFPKMSAETKAQILTIAIIAVIIFRPWKQPKGFRPEEGATVPVAIIRVPDTVAVGPDAVVIATEVERAKAEPGVGG